MEGMSQSAARLQLRKPPVFTFLLKEIVGLALEPGQSHAGLGSFIITTSCCAELEDREGYKGFQSADLRCEPGNAPSPSGPQCSHASLPP